MSRTMSSAGSDNTGSEESGKREFSAAVRKTKSSCVIREVSEISKINYISSNNLLKSVLSMRQKSIIGVSNKATTESLIPIFIEDKFAFDTLEEKFSVNVTSLMNENQYWGCFYVFPELYSDCYSPTVHVRSAKDALPTVEGVLTRNLVSTYLSYLKHVPILEDYVYMKLQLANMSLTNIAVLQNYKFLVYLDLSHNYLTNISVLSHLLYLQYLSVAFNRLESVLEYETPQWFLTEVHYKYNAVTEIRDIRMFWSITVLDLSNNYIKVINGLENLKYLRTLDLSFNHIQKLENLNDLPLLWLDLSYNNISEFEFGTDCGLWTLLQLEYLNVNENNLTTLKLFSGCCRLRELYARNNLFGSLVELAVFMRKLRLLEILDLRANPICSEPGFKVTVTNTFPKVINLNSEALDPYEQSLLKMEMCPDVVTFATRRLQRLLYVEQLQRATLSTSVPPADIRSVPLIVLVGPVAVGKFSLANRLAEEWKDRIQLAYLHTTSKCHPSDHYIQISREKFDEMIINGDFLTYNEEDAESFGLSRDQAIINDGKMRIVCMDLVSALMLHLRGRRPYLILTTVVDRSALALRQLKRKIEHDHAMGKWLACPCPASETMQIALSARFIIAGILNDIMMVFPENESQTEFVYGSDCSLLFLQLLYSGKNVQNEMEEEKSVTEEKKQSEQVLPEEMTVKATSLKEPHPQRVSQQRISIDNKTPKRHDTSSLHSLYHQRRESMQTQDSRKGEQRERKISYARSSTKGSSFMRDTTKSVTFEQGSPAGGLLEGDYCFEDHGLEEEGLSKSQRGSAVSSSHDHHDHDLWFNFLNENAYQSIAKTRSSSDSKHSLKKLLSNLEALDESDLRKIIDFYHKISNESISTSSRIREDYETVHRNRPGLFWDTIQLDDPEEAYKKLKQIVQDIVASQSTLQPLFDLNFTRLEGYPNVQKTLTKIKKQLDFKRHFF